MSEQEKPEAREAADPELSPEEQLKQRYREALARKQGKGSGGEGHADAESKVHGAHASEAHQKSFRRKAGG